MNIKSHPEIWGEIADELLPSEIVLKSFNDEGGDLLDPMTLFYTGVLVGIYCWKKAKEKKTKD